MFRTVSLSIIRSLALYTQQWYMSYRFADSLWAGSRRNALISQIYFWNKTLHVSDISSVHHQEFFHCKHSNGICLTGSVLILLASCQQTCKTYPCCVYSEKFLMMDRNCPKHVEFYSKNKFKKLVHLVGFIIRIRQEIYFLFDIF